MAVTIHPTALVDKSAELDDGVFVGAYSAIKGKVQIGRGTQIDHQVSIKGPTTIGANCHFFPFSSVGGDPQDLKYHGEETKLAIGDACSIREFVSINRGTVQGGGWTKLGSHSLIMASCHIAHDCILGHHTIMANTTNLAGHIVVGDHVTFGGYTGVSQKIKIGSYVMTGGYANLRLDVAPFVIIVGNDKARIIKPNIVRLERCQFTAEEIAEVKGVVKTFFRTKLTKEQALEEIGQKFPGRHAKHFIDFVRASSGLHR